MEKRQSVLGIISTVFSLSSCTLIFFVLIIVAIVEDNSPGYLEANQLADNSLLAGLLIGIMIAVIAIILGAIGCFEKEKTRVFCVIGISIGFLSLLSTSIMILAAINQYI